jgi:dihydroflavonol-4-reductase
MNTVFVTGASGFLGGHLVHELVAEGCTVKALSRRAESDAAIRALGAEPVRAALDDQASLAQAIKGCHAVFHAAADTSVWRAQAASQTATNVLGTQNVLQAARTAGVSAFMHTSSVSAWSHQVHGVLREDLPQKGGSSWINYERTKYVSERQVRSADLPWIVFNPAHILGPGDRHNWARLIRLIDRQKLPGIPPGSGSFADVRQVAKAQVRAWRQQRFGQAYLLGGEHLSFQDFVAGLSLALGVQTRARVMPPWLLKPYARVLQGVAAVRGVEPQVTPEGAALTSHHLQVDSSKAVRDLAYVITGFDALLAATLDWMRHEGLLLRRD